MILGSTQLLCLASFGRRSSQNASRSGPALDSTKLQTDHRAQRHRNHELQRHVLEEGRVDSACLKMGGKVHLKSWVKLGCSTHCTPGGFRGGNVLR